MNNTVMKNNYFPSPPKLVRIATLHIFATLPNVWLNRRELDSRQILHAVTCKIICLVVSGLFHCTFMSEQE